jgi:hypothetical protein
MIRKKQPEREIIIDLYGSDGNAFVLLGYAKQFARQLGLDATVIQAEMMAGDYENLLEVFDRNFGKFVILER